MWRLAAVILFLVLFADIAYASHQVEVRYPTSITTTVGELITIQIDLKNKEPSAEAYRIVMKATLQSMEITNPNINTQTINPGGSVSVFSNIRTLTDAPNVLTIEIFGDTDLSPTKTISIAVQSKKFSLPEFGLPGFIQIVAIASIVYFWLGKKIILRKAK